MAEIIQPAVFPENPYTPVCPCCGHDAWHGVQRDGPVSYLTCARCGLVCKVETSRLTREEVTA